MNEIRHGTHRGAALCYRTAEGICPVCRQFLTEYQRERRADIREKRLRELCAQVGAERKQRQKRGAAA